MNDQTSEKQSWWQRLSGGLKRTSSSIGGTVSDLVAKRRLDQTMLDEIEDLLIRVDLGVETAARIAVAVGEGRYDKSITTDEVKAVVAAEVEKVLTPVAKPLAIKEAKPFVALVIGVNGSGKTTTIGKIAAKLRAEGRSVMLAAGDTFRAAAIDQLNIWGGRSGASVIARAPGADAAGVAFDALTEARGEEVDEAGTPPAGNRRGERFPLHAIAVGCELICKPARRPGSPCDASSRRRTAPRGSSARPRNSRCGTASGHR